MDESLSGRAQRQHRSSAEGPEPAPLLVVDRVTKSYALPPWWLRAFVRTAVKEPIEALRDVSFSVAAGEVVGLVGPNGAGKTTLMRVIANLLEPDGGRALIDGVDVRAGGWDVRSRLGLVLESDRGFYRRLSGRRNLEFFAIQAGMDRATAATRVDQLLSQFGLADRDKLLFGYSSGMRVRLSVARALVADPSVLVLDEPTRGLDPVASFEVGEMLRRLAKEGRAVLFSDHRLDELVSVCDRVVVLVGGQVIFEGRPGDLEEGSGVTAAAALRQMMVE